MKHDKKQFVEILLKMSYHAHQIEFYSDEDKQYLDMLLKRDNSSMLYENKEGEEN